MLTTSRSVENDILRGIMENFPEASISMRCLSWKYAEMKFSFQDYEDDSVYELDLEKLRAALPLIWSVNWPCGCTKPISQERLNDPDAIDDWLCQMDATDFDAFVQLAIFGEVIYG